MKKAVLLLGMVAMTISSFAQVKITKTVDEMTDKVYHFVSERLIAANSAGNKGCAISMSIKSSNGTLISKSSIVQMVGLGRCNENNTIILLFDNGDKVSIDSWNPFNCDGTVYFNFSKANIKKMRTNPLSKIRITNGRSYESYTAEVEYKNYFIDFYKELDRLNE